MSQTWPQALLDGDDSLEAELGISLNEVYERLEEVDSDHAESRAAQLLSLDGEHVMGKPPSWVPTSAGEDTHPAVSWTSYSPDAPKTRPRDRDHALTLVQSVSERPRTACCECACGRVREGLAFAVGCSLASALTTR